MGADPAGGCLGPFEGAAGAHLQPSVLRGRMQLRVANPEDFPGKVKNLNLFLKSLTLPNRQLKPELPAQCALRRGHGEVSHALGEHSFSPI